MPRYFWKSQGSTQWQNGYPNADIIIEDIISGQAYVALEDGELLAYAAVTKSPEAAYEPFMKENGKLESQST